MVLMINTVECQNSEFKITKHQYDICHFTKIMKNKLVRRFRAKTNNREETYSDIFVTNSQKKKLISSYLITGFH